MIRYPDNTLRHESVTNECQVQFWRAMLSIYTAQYAATRNRATRKHSIDQISKSYRRLGELAA